MAPRRLIFVLLVILMVSSFAAALVPVPEDDERETTSATESAREPKEESDARAEARQGPDEGERDGTARPGEGTPGDAAGEGSDGLRQATISASGRRPSTVRARVGDDLTLTVTSRRSLDVEIAEFGEFAPADPDLPAVFELVASEPGTYPVRAAGTGRLIGRLEFRQAAR